MHGQGAITQYLLDQHSLVLNDTAKALSLACRYGHLDCIKSIQISLSISISDLQSIQTDLYPPMHSLDEIASFYKRTEILHYLNKN